MNDNELLARWQGLENVRPTRLSNGTIVIIYNSNEIVPDYLNDPAACMSLLDTLVKKGYEYSFGYANGRHDIHIDLRSFPPILIWREGPTRHEAIIAACLEVARKEQGNE